MNRRFLLCTLAVTLACAKSESTGGTGGNSGANGGSTGSTGGNPGGTGGTTGTGGGTGAGGATGGTTGAGGSTGGSTGAGGTTAAGGNGGSPASGGTTGTGGNGGNGGSTASGGTTGTGGGVGSGGSLGTGGTTVVNDGTCGKLLPTPTSESVLTRGKNAQRNAHFIHPSLKISAVSSAKFAADATFNTAAKFTGNLEGTPLFVAGSTPGAGMYIVASHGNGHSWITAIDETMGTTLWTRDMGAAGNGVRSTPVIDPATSTIYSAFDATTGGNHYEVHAMSLANKGAELTGWPIDVTNIQATNGNTIGALKFGDMIQRGSLSLVNGVLYVPFGGVYGDDNMPPAYKGFVIAINTQTPTMRGGWSVSGNRSGLWQSGGLASDGTSLYASTSNGSDGSHIDSEEVVRITGMGTSSNAAKDKFFPSYWQNWDGHDNDLGSSSPMVLQFSGQCQSLVVAPSKPGHLFFLDPANLGGGNGSTALRDFLVATGSSNTGGEGGEYKVFYAAPTGYISTSGVHVALEARLDAACPNGKNGGDSLVGIKVDMTTTPPTPSVQWCAGVAGGEDRHHPISTTTDGVQDAIVWLVVGGGLKAFNGETGDTLFGSTTCGNFEKQTAPIEADGHVVIGADGRLCSYSVQP